MEDSRVRRPEVHEHGPTGSVAAFPDQDDATIVGLDRPISHSGHVQHLTHRVW
jgi:hypothetical protein